MVLDEIEPVETFNVTNETRGEEQSKELLMWGLSI